MRHRLFHAIVIVGSSLPMACGPDEASVLPLPDAATDAPVDGSSAADTGAVGPKTDTGAADSATTDSTAADTGPADTGAADAKTDGAATDAGPDVCDGGCGSSCFPCIK